MGAYRSKSGEQPNDSQNREEILLWQEQKLRFGQIEIMALKKSIRESMPGQESVIFFYLPDRRLRNLKSGRFYGRGARYWVSEINRKLSAKCLVSVFQNRRVRNALDDYYVSKSGTVKKLGHVKILGVTIPSLIRYDKATRTGKGRGI